MTASPRSNWNYPTAVRFGAGRISELAEASRNVGMAAPLIVTDPVLATQPDDKGGARPAHRRRTQAAVFSDIKPNPVETNVYRGLEALKAGKHDGVVAFGGGSALDAGKVIAFMAGQTRPMWDFEDIGDWWTRADPRDPADHRRADDCRDRLGGRPRGRHHQEATHTKKVIFHPR